jgi:uncharacterized protein (DUF58 family)
MSKQDWRDFFVTSLLLGGALLVALLSSAAAERGDSAVAQATAAAALLLALIGAVYIVPKLARRVRLELLRARIKTSVTVEGALFLVLLLVVGLAAWNAGNNLLNLVLSAMLAFLLAGNLISRASLSDISVQLLFPDHIFAGEVAPLTLTIKNHKRFLPSFSLVIEAVSEGGTVPDLFKDLAHFAVVPAGGGARQRFERMFSKRGRLLIAAFRASTRFPAGFFKKWRDIEAAGELLVYPKPRPISDFYHALPMLAGQVSSYSRGSGDDLFSIRRYQPSDHMRHIDWKATAKTSELMVREHMREDERRLTIVFDTSRPENREGFEDKFERAIVMAASLAHHFILERADVELITPLPEYNVGSGRGIEHLYRILRSLALLQPDESAPGLKGLLGRVPVLANERHFKVLLTSAPKGTIPANVWRSAHVIFIEDL